MNVLSQILWSPVGAEIIFILSLKLRLGEVREFIQGYPASKDSARIQAQWVFSDIHLLLPFAIFLHMNLISSVCLNLDPPFCEASKTVSEYCSYRKEDLFASGQPHCEVGKLSVRQGWKWGHKKGRSITD